MKNYSYALLLVLFCFSCKSIIIAQEKKQKIVKPKFEDLINKKTIAPNTIKLQAIILKKVKSTTICNTRYDSALEVKVIQTLGSGSGITNMITKDQKLTFVLNNSTKQTTIPEIRLGKIVHLTVREGLCEKANESLYEIID